MASLNGRRTVEGVETEVIIQLFADSILVLVTQLGKVGSLIQASIPATARSNVSSDEQDRTAGGQLDLPVPSPSIELTRVLGSPSSDFLTTLQSLYASQIATIVWKQTEGNISLHDIQPSRKVIIGLALKPHHHEDSGVGGLSDSARNTFLGIMQIIIELLTQGQA